MDFTKKLPEEIVSQILARATLPSSVEEITPHWDPIVLGPAAALCSKLTEITTVSTLFNRLALDAHFSQNQQRVRLLIDTQFARDDDDGNLIVAQWDETYIFSGTFEQHPIFLENTKHLGVDIDVRCWEAADVYIDKICELVLGCKALTRLTLYLDKIYETFVDVMRRQLEDIVEEAGKRRGRLVRLELVGKPKAPHSTVDTWLEAPSDEVDWTDMSGLFQD